MNVATWNQLIWIGIALLGADIAYELTGRRRGRVLVTLVAVAVWAAVSFGALGVEHYVAVSNPPVVEENRVMLVLGAGLCLVSLVEFIDALGDELGDATEDARNATHT